MALQRVPVDSPDTTVSGPATGKPDTHNLKLLHLAIGIWTV